MKIYAVLSHFGKCRDLRVKSAPQLPEIEGGGGQPIWAMPVFRLLFYKNCFPNRKYPRLDILFTIGDIKSPVGDNIPNWGLGISESGKAESENKSTIPNWIRYVQLVI